MTDKIELPNIEILMDLAKNNPDELLLLRDRLVEQVIERNNNDKTKEKLQALNTKIRKLESTSSNPLQACVKIYNLMNKKVDELNFVFKNGYLPDEQKNINNVISLKNRI